jgi:thioredoxin-related protein
MSRIIPSFLLFAVFISGSIQVAAQAQQDVKPAGSQQKIKWMTFTEAYSLNKKKPKKIFIDVYTDWCGWCKKMDATTFMNPDIVKYMNDNFYCVKMNAEMKDTVVIDGVTFVNQNPTSSRSSHQLAVELLRGKMSYPSYVFLNDKSQFLTVVPGYQQAKEFEAVLHYFGEGAYNGTSWEEYRSSFKGKIE